MRERRRREEEKKVRDCEGRDGHEWVVGGSEAVETADGGCRVGGAVGGCAELKVCEGLVPAADGVACVLRLRRLLLRLIC